MIGRLVDYWRERRDPIAVLFPPTCILCGAPGRLDGAGWDLCEGCARELPYNRAACIQCALPLPSAMAFGMRCALCQRHPPSFDRTLAPLRYEGAVPLLVRGAKFRGRLNQARLLGQCLAEWVAAANLEPPQVLLPVPLHAARLRERGYNQSLEIARVVGRELAIPVDHASCVRIRATPPQAGLNERARRLNLRGAFALRGTPTWSHVALLDDVMTTGSTVAELSRVLRLAGVRWIQVWAVARTP
ncbi:MAG: ComF family protein [Sphingobacteriia bacterium]|nr:ComF family protein [Sphingobacteriia bacterium]NCC37848.1 ComF family protein [Gammaproteobacteria bacterium]